MQGCSQLRARASTQPLNVSSVYIKWPHACRWWHIYYDGRALPLHRPLYHGPYGPGNGAAPAGNGACRGSSGGSAHLRRVPRADTRRGGSPGIPKGSRNSASGRNPKSTGGLVMGLGRCCCFFTAQTGNYGRAVQVPYGRRARLRRRRSGPACLGGGGLILGQQPTGRARAVALGGLAHAPLCRCGYQAHWAHFAESRDSPLCVTLRSI